MLFAAILPSWPDLELALLEAVLHLGLPRVFVRIDDDNTNNNTTTSNATTTTTNNNNNNTTNNSNNTY